MRFFWPNGTSGAVTISFDDGYASTYQNTVFSLKERGLSATYNIIPAYVNKVFNGEKTANWEQWCEANKMGHEVASHGFTHAPLAGRMSDFRRFIHNLKITPDPISYIRQLMLTIYIMRRWKNQRQEKTNEQPTLNLINDLTESRAIIDRKITGLPTVSFAYPSGRYTTNSKKAVASAGFCSARTLDLGLNNHLSDLFSLNSIAMAPGMSVNDYSYWLDKACKANEWLIIVLHLVAEKNPNQYPYFCSIKEWDHLLNLVEQYPLWVADQREIVNFITSQVDKTNDLY